MDIESSSFKYQLSFLNLEQTFKNGCKAELMVLFVVFKKILRIAL